LQLELWRPRKQTITHSSIDDKFFDCRNPTSRRHYYQTLLSLGDRLIANEGINSDQPGSYYQLVLLDKKVECGLGDKQYKALLKHYVDGTPLLALPAPEPLPALEDADSDFDIGNGQLASLGPAAKVILGPKAKVAPAPNALLDLVPPAPPTPPAPKESSSSDSSSSSDADDSSFDHGGRSAVSKYFEIPDGPRVKLDQYKSKDKGDYRRWIGACSHHKGCEKKRAVDKCSVFGKIEPLAFLAAWDSKGASVPKEEHTRRNFIVPPEDVAVWAARLGSNCNHIIAILK
jgi:hypothetical protein